MRSFTFTNDLEGQITVHRTGCRELAVPSVYNSRWVVGADSVELAMAEVLLELNRHADRTAGEGWEEADLVVFDCCHPREAREGRGSENA